MGDPAVTEVSSLELNTRHAVGERSFMDFPAVTKNATNMSNPMIISSGHLFELYEKAALEIYIYPLVLLLVFIFIGMIGNIFVMYIFTFQWERNKTSVFIITLAVLDIINCSINMPIEVVVLFKPMSFDYDLFCKAARCFSYIITAAYSFVLVAVAFDRYLMICRPLKRMTLGTTYATKTCVGAVLTAVLTQWPSFFLYGTFVFQLPVDIPSGNGTFANTTSPLPQVFVQGKTCLVTNYYYYINRMPTFLFQGFLFICHVIIFITLTVVYILIGRRLYISSHIDIVDSSSQQGLLKRSIMSAITGTTGSSTKTSASYCEEDCSGQPKRGSKNRYRAGQPRGSADLGWKKENPAFVQMSPSKFRSLHCIPIIHGSDSRNDLSKQETQSLTGSFVMEPINGSRNVRNKDTIYGSQTGSPNFGKPSITRSASLDIAKLHSTANGQNSLKPNTDLKEMSLRRNTLIMRMVTFTFMLSYLPFLILVTLRYSDPDVPTKLDKTAKIVYHVFLRTYFLNSVIRPFIYIVMNDRYRAKVKTLLKKCSCQ